MTAPTTMTAAESRTIKDQAFGAPPQEARAPSRSPTGWRLDDLSENTATPVCRPGYAEPVTAHGRR